MKHETTANPPGAGVLLCSCGGKLLDRERTEALRSRLSFGGVDLADIYTPAALCTAAGREAARAFLEKRKLRRAVCAGCASASAPGGRPFESAAGSPTTTHAARLLGDALHQASFPWVPLTGRPDDDAREIRKALAVLDVTPEPEVREVPLDPRILVVGNGDTARRAALRAASLGHPVTLVGSASTDRGVEAIQGGSLIRLQGQVGGFTALLDTRGRRSELRCGALIVTRASVAAGADELRRRFATRLVVPLPELPGYVAALPRVRRVRTVAIVLDLETEESRAGTEAALRTAGALQRQGALQVHLFAHDARVAYPGLQELYDAVRGAGVVVDKYDGELRIEPNGDGVLLRSRDAGLGGEAEFACDLVGVSLRGLRPALASEPLARTLGVGTDPMGRLQENNIHLLPVLTSRLGIFVAGAARGEYFEPAALLEAEAAARAAHELLAPGKLRVELSNAVVDPDKCALCLSCVRACPHGAMGIDEARKSAASSPEACRRCGICAGECPARAITLPAWSDRVIRAQLGAPSGAGSRANV